MNDDLYQEALRRRKTLLEDLGAIEAELRSLENSILMWDKRSVHSGLPPTMIGSPRTSSLGAASLGSSAVAGAATMCYEPSEARNRIFVQEV